MKRNLIKLILAVFLALITTNVMSQENGDMSVGGNLVTGTDGGFTNYGIGAKFRWNVIKQLRLEPSFTYFLGKEYKTSEINASMWDFSVNAHYLFPFGSYITIYPLAGLGILGIEYDSGYGSDSGIGLTLGGGVDLNITDNLILDFQMKLLGVNGGLVEYVSDDLPAARIMLSAGIAYNF